MNGSQLKPLTISELEAHIQTELNQSGNWSGSEFRDAIRESLDYMLYRNKGDEIPGRSQIQDGTVADMVDHVQAELQPMYCVDTLFEVGQEGPDDEQAEMETAALNWYWKERLRGSETLDEAIQDGLLSRNGYLKIWYEESAGLPYEETLQGDELQVRASLMQLQDEGNKLDLIEATVLSEAIVAEPNPVVQEMTGGALQPMVMLDRQISVEVKITPMHREVRASSPAPEDVFVSRDAVGSNMQEPRFVAENRRITRQEVIGLGIAEKDALRLTEMTGNYNSDVKTARKTDNNEYRQSSADVLGRVVELFEVYFKIDWDRDGVTELLKVFCSRQGTIMHWADESGGQGEPCIEMVRVRPFASGSPMKLSHRHQGRSIFDKQRTIEDTKRAMVRQMIDNMTEANNTTTIWPRDVDDEDIEETEVGRQVRADNPSMVVPFKHNNIVADSIPALAYMDKRRDERTGASISTSRENMPVQQAAHSTERIMSAMERIVGMYARNFTNTLIRDAGVLLHEQLKLLPGKIAFEVGNEWQETEPRYWIQRNRISVTMGKSDGEKARYMAALDRVIGIQREDRALGVLTKQEYEARLDFTRMADLNDSGQYWLDPESPEGQAAAQAQQQAAQQQQQLAFQGQQMVLAAQMRVTEMQEATKRMENQQKMLEDQRDRLAEMMQAAEKLRQQYVEMELKYGADVPGEGIEDGELADIKVTLQ